MDAQLVALTGGVGRAEVVEAARELFEGKLDTEIGAAAIAQRESDIADALSANAEVAHASRRVSVDADAFADVVTEGRPDTHGLDGLLLDGAERAAAASMGLPFVRRDEPVVGLDVPVIAADVRRMASVLAGQRMDASDISSELELSMSDADADGGGDEGGGDEGGEE